MLILFKSLLRFQTFGMLSDYLFVILNKLLVVAKEKCEDLGVVTCPIKQPDYVFFFGKATI